VTQHTSGIASAPCDDLLKALPRQRWLTRLVRRAWTAYWQWQIRRATARLLYSLDDRVLRDIGIERDEIGLHLYEDRRTGPSEAAKTRLRSRCGFPW
jgi:uncharacterized protein YjiS (DUF1127 family)